MSQYNDIKITPNIGVSSDPKIEFIGAGNSTVTLKVLDTFDGGITFEGQKGELLSLVDADVSFGSSVASFSVNDFYGVPQIQSYNDGRVLVAPYGAQTVGIGTTNPQAKLDVGIGSVYVSNGDVHIDGTLYLFNTRNAYGGFFTNGGLDGNAYLNNLSPGGVTGFGVKLPSGSAGSFEYPDLGDLYITLKTRHNGTQGITNFNGFVGIGTTNPETNLDVVGDIRVTGVSSFFGGPVLIDNAPLLIGSGTSTGTESQKLQVTGNAYVSDNLGIGTTVPSTKMDVRGDVRVGIDTSQGLILTSPNGTTFRLVVDDSGTLGAISTTL